MVLWSRRVFLAAIGLQGIWAQALLADVPPRSREELLQQAHLILVGHVAELRVKTERSRSERGFGNYDWAIYVTIQVDEVEKGQIESSEAVVARCFRIKSRKSVTEFMTPGGNRPIPDVGTHVRAYLEGDGGEWQVTIANGFQSVSEDVELRDAAAVARLEQAGFTYVLPIELWAVLSLVALLAFSLLRARRRSRAAGHRHADTTVSASLKEVHP